MKQEDCPNWQCIYAKVLRQRGRNFPTKKCSDTCMYPGQKEPDGKTYPDIVFKILNAYKDDFITRERWEQVAHQLREPDFKNKRRVHDWRNYIDAVLQPIWGELSLEARFIAFILAETQASKEEWE